MATENETTTTAAEKKLPDEIKIVSHSSLFYWWPVWAIGFVMGVVSFYFPGHHLITAPTGAERAQIVGKAKVKVPVNENEHRLIDLEEGRYVIYAPEKKNELSKPGVTVSTSSRPGVIFCVILMIVITITNIHLRGLWSLVVVVIIVALVVILALIPGAWDMIFKNLEILDIRINTAGYFFISGILCTIWLIVVYVFDRQRYMVFKPGEFKVRLEIGEGETSYDTRNMTVKKERSDFFRHWILGLGSGDMTVKTAQGQQFDMDNVLFLNSKVNTIQDMARTVKETK